MDLNKSQTNNSSKKELRETKQHLSRINSIDDGLLTDRIDEIDLTPRINDILFKNDYIVNF